MKKFVNFSSTAGRSAGYPGKWMGRSEEKDRDEAPGGVGFTGIPFISRDEALRLILPARIHDRHTHQADDRFL